MNKTHRGKADNSLLIEEDVKNGLSYLSATCKFLEENSINFDTMHRHISSAIIQKIIVETIASDTICPSIRKKHNRVNLEDMF